MGWDSIGVVVFLLITLICKLFSCVLHGVYAFQDGRRGLSTSENMLFLPWEGRFLRARRAYTRMQNITRWFLVGYILGCRRWYMRVVRVVGLVGCKDFLSFCWSLSLTVFTPAIAITFCEICMPEAFCGFETVRKYVLLTLWVLWEKELPSELFVCHLIEWVRPISHRFTQKNRTHSIPQRH